MYLALQQIAFLSMAALTCVPLHMLFKEYDTDNSFAIKTRCVFATVLTTEWAEVMLCDFQVYIIIRQYDSTCCLFCLLLACSLSKHSLMLWKIRPHGEAVPVGFHPAACFKSQLTAGIKCQIVSKQAFG